MKATIKTLALCCLLITTAYADKEIRVLFLYDHGTAVHLYLKKNPDGTILLPSEGRSVVTEKAKAAISILNLVMDANHLPYKFILADVRRLPITIDSNAYPTPHNKLYLIAANTKVKKIRRSTLADIVLTYVIYPDTTDHTVLGTAHSIPAKPEDAYVVVHGAGSPSNEVKPNYVEAHEIGHLMGGVHEQAINKVKFKNDPASYATLMYPLGQVGIKTSLYFSGVDFKNPSRNNRKLVGTGLKKAPLFMGSELYDKPILNSVNFGYWAKKSGVTRLSGDFDGDKREDIALIRGGKWKTIPVAYSDRDGTFDARNIWDLGRFIERWAAYGTPHVGDFDGDKRDDIALIGGDWNSIPIAYSSGRGAFTVDDIVVGAFAENYAQRKGTDKYIGDFDADGLSDILLLGGEGVNGIAVAYSNGVGILEPIYHGHPASQAFGNHAQRDGIRRLVGDFNGDGADDIVLLSRGQAQVSVAYGRNDRNFEIESRDFNFLLHTWTSTSQAEPYVGDFNGDGKSDIALIGDKAWDTIPILFGQGGQNRSFEFDNVSLQNKNFITTWIHLNDVSFHIAKVNGDEADDILIIGGDNWVTSTTAFFQKGENDTKGSFRVTSEILPGNFAQWLKTGYRVIGDFNGDKRDDIGIIGASRKLKNIPVVYTPGVYGQDWE